MDDIDIEEHDVFDNPRIRNIFPDISQIKTEVHDFDTKDPEEQPGFSSQICYEDNPLDDDNYDHFNDDENYEMDYADATTTDYNSLDIYHSNKIIIGSKPNLTTEVVLPESDLYIEALNSNVRVCLENWGDILKVSKCFCKDCGTLFATVNALDAHKMTAHSFLVELDDDRVIRRNYAKKSTVVHKTVESQSCFHCNRIFPNFLALTHHLYEVLGVNHDKEVKKPDESSCEEAVDTTFKCTKCGCIFKEEKTMLNHLKSNHGYVGSDALKFAIPPLSYPLSFMCTYCNSHTSSIKAHNAHIKKKHEDLFLKKPTQSVGYKCMICKLVFERYNLARYHRKTVHTNMYNKPILKRFVRKPGTQFAIVKDKVVNPKIEPGPSKATEVVKCDIKSKNKRPSRRRFDVKLYKQSRSVDLMNSPIPKSVLFRCQKCEIHFISASLTMRHFPVCIRGCSKYVNCRRCNRVVRFEDRHIHDHQHKVSSKIKVYDISIRVLERTLCKCPKCDICYDDRDFWTHFDKCGESESSFCDKCNLLISAQNIEAHKFKHENEVNDFIVIDFISLDDAKTEVIYKHETGHVENIAKSMIVNDKAKVKGNYKAKPFKTASKIDSEAVVRKPKMTLRYCDVCECSFASLKHIKVYPDCKKVLKKQVCPHCGLYFTNSMYKHHRRVHKLKTITLHDFKFVNLIDSSIVIPKAPEYPKCPKCNVYYVTKSQIAYHACQEQNPKICRECNKRFSPHAFRLHSQFHLYGKVARVKQNDLQKVDMPVLLQKYESLKKMWNVLYLCTDCETLSDNYEHAVEHSQKHLNDMIDHQNANIKTCNKCDLEFELRAYIKHQKLHNSTSLKIKRNTFKILKYNYRNLLSRNWFKLFGDLPKEHINCIVSRSMYKATKNVRMKVLRVGHGSTFYQCASCKNYIDENSVYDHTHNEKCSIEHHTPKPPHIGKHSRIISFKHQTDIEFNDTLKIVDHTKVDKKPVKLKKQNIKKLYDVYQCGECGVTLIHKQNIKRHMCSKRRAWQCKKCDQPYLMQRRHEQYHIALPNFHKDTINVVMFNRADYSVNKKSSGKSQFKVKFPSKIAAKIKNKVLKPAAPNQIPVTKVYKCKCGLHFTSLLTIAKHFDICHRDTIPSSKCSRCKLLFPTDILVSHLVKHHRENEWKIIVEDVEPRMKQVQLYECARCSLLFPRKKDATGHQDCCNNNGKRCHDCNLIFHTDSFDAHECTEYIENNIVTVNNEEGEITVQDSADESTFNETRASGSENTTINSNETLCDELRRTVFKCAMCDIHYINIDGWYRHVELDHVVKYRTAECSECNLTYSSTKALINHRKIHHKNHKIDFCVKVMDSDVIKKMKASKDSKESSKVFYLDDSFDPNVGIKYGVTDKMYSTLLKTSYDNTLYKCHLCPQHFVTRATWLKHIYCATNHDSRVVECPKCEYTFVEQSLLRHQFIHHEKMKLNKEDIDVISFTETNHRKHKQNADSDIDAMVNDLNKPSDNDVSIMADSNDDEDDSRESAAKKTKYASDDAIKCIDDDENIVSSSTKDFV